MRGDVEQAGQNGRPETTFSYCQTGDPRQCDGYAVYTRGSDVCLGVIHHARGEGWTALTASGGADHLSNRREAGLWLWRKWLSENKSSEWVRRPNRIRATTTL